MSKRIVSVILAVMLLLTTAMVTASAAPAQTGIDPAGTAIYFNAESVGWESAKYVGFHIWEVGGDPFSDWGGKAERGTLCKEYNEQGEEIDVPCFIWQFDFAKKGITLDPDKQYGVIFYNDKGGQTYNLLFDTTCLGDIADCDTTNTFENPEDSEKVAYPAYWRKQDPKVNGPELKITSIGNVVGSCLPKSMTTVDLMREFLVKTLENARIFSGLGDQEIIDNIGKKLGMNKDDVAAAIVASEVETEWTKEASVLPAGHSSLDAGKIDFDAKSAEWEGSAYIGFHIWELGTDPFYEWGAKQQRGSDDDGDGVWSYHLAEHDIVLDPGKQYGVIFYNDQGDQTYNLLFTTACVGDTAYCADEAILENPVDSDKETKVAYWRNQDPYVNGPELIITSIGTVVGICVPQNTSKAQLFREFLINHLDNAREHSGLTDHQLIENIAKALNLTAEDVVIISNECGVYLDWDYAKTELAHSERNPGDPDIVSYQVDVTEGEGTVSKSKKYLVINFSLPPQYQYDVVTLTATPAEGYRFAGWDIEGTYQLEEDCRLSDPQITIQAYMNDDFVTTVHARFAPIEHSTLRGDYDEDGEITIMDATRVQNIIAELVARPDEAFLVSIDADGDGELTILDATRIQRVIAELCDWGGSELHPKDGDELPFVPV